MEGRMREGEAYAVLTDAGELVFFRSEEKYKDWESARARDVFGNECEGVVCAGVETKQWSFAVRPSWHDKRVKSVRIADGQAIAPVSCAWWFSFQRALRLCDLEGLDTSKVMNMDSMFTECTSLQTPPDTSKWDTSRVKDMHAMFTNCISLKTPPDTSRWDTSRVEDMSHMFASCTLLKTPPDTRGWDTHNVENMDSMFTWCKSLKEPPDTSRWDTSKVMNMSHMFSDCWSLKNPPTTSKWDVGSLQGYDYMFLNCNKLKWVPDIGAQVHEDSVR